MTDPSAMQNMPELERSGIPSQLVGGDRPASIEGRKLLHSSPSELKSYTGGEVMRFSIPCEANSYLMPDVQLRMTVRASANANVDYSASSFISRLRIFHQSQLLEDIQDYNRLRSIINDVTQSPVNSSTISEVLEGTPQSGGGFPFVAVAGGSPTDAEITAWGQSLSETLKIVPRCRVNNLPANTDKTYTISLVSGVIGALNPKALPLHAMTAGAIRVEITLASNNDAIIANQATTWALSLCELRSTIVQVSNNAQQLIDQAVGGNYVVNSSTYAHAQSNFATGDSTANVLLPFSYSSLKHIVHGAYNQANRNVVGRWGVTGRSKCNIEQLFYQVGASRVPSNPLTQKVDILTEVCKCFGVSSDLLQVSNHLTRLNVDVDDSTVITGEVGRFCLGFDFETFGATSSSTRIENGVNTTAIQLYANIQTGAGSTLGIAGELHSWANYDVLYTAQNGQLYARF